MDKDKYLSRQLANKAEKAFWDFRGKPETRPILAVPAIGSVIKSITHPELDPTKGSNQWRGGKGSGEVQINSPKRSKFWHRFFKINKSYKGNAPIVD